MYPVTDVPPSSTGRVHATYAKPLPALAETMSGVAGTCAAVLSMDPNAGPTLALSTMDDGASAGPVTIWLQVDPKETK